MAHKAKRKPKILRLLGTMLLIAILGYCCYMYVNQGMVLSRQNEQIARMEEENALLEEEYQKMLQQVSDKTTLEYVDKYMRSHFGMVQEGEIRIDVVEQ